MTFYKPSTFFLNGIERKLSSKMTILEGIKEYDAPEMTILESIKEYKEYKRL